MFLDGLGMVSRILVGHALDCKVVQPKTRDIQRKAKKRARSRDQETRLNAHSEDALEARGTTLDIYEIALSSE